MHKSIRLSGRSGSAIPENHVTRMREIREIASEYELKGICNMGESRLLYRMGPRKSYLSPNEDPRLARGTDLQK